MEHPSDPRVALVTGAGRGLGAGIARILARHGYAVAVNDLRSSLGAARVVADIEAEGGRAEFFPADATDSREVHAMGRDIGATLGSVDVLVANASGPQPEILLEDLTWPDMEAHLGFFVRSPMLLAQAVLPGMRAAGRGRIILIGSDLFERGLPGWSGYAAAKGAMIGLARSWSRELGPDGITVNVVAPGWIPVERHADTPVAVRDSYLAELPLDRFGTPSDVGEVVAFLASDAASFVTGERIAVNGGHLLT